MTESELKTFNNRRMAFLRTLVHEAESKWRAKQLEEADVQYADFRSSAH